MDRSSTGQHLGTNQNCEAVWLSCRNEGLSPQRTPTDSQREPRELPRHPQGWLSGCPCHLARSTDSCVGQNSEAPSHELMGGWVPNPAVHGFGMYSLHLCASAPPPPPFCRNESGRPPALGPSKPGKLHRGLFFLSLPNCVSHTCTCMCMYKPHACKTLCAC